MAITGPVDLDTLKLRAEIQSMYARVAADPSGEFHFHRGPEYAATGSTTTLSNSRSSLGR